MANAVLTNLSPCLHEADPCEAKEINLSLNAGLIFEIVLPYVSLLP